MNSYIANDSNFIREISSILRTDFTFVSSDLESAFLKDLIPFKKKDILYLPFFYEKDQQIKVLNKSSNNNNNYEENKNEKIHFNADYLYINNNLKENKSNEVAQKDYKRNFLKKKILFLLEIIFMHLIKLLQYSIVKFYFQRFWKNSSII